MPYVPINDIETAVDRVFNGDTIYVNAGNYNPEDQIDLDKSIIKYFNLFFFIFFRISIGKLVSPNIKPIILFLRKRCANRSFFILCYKFNNILY